MPVHPQTEECAVKQDWEAGYTPDFQIMDSKNNNDRHRFEREYFDSPHAYLK